MKAGRAWVRELKQPSSRIHRARTILLVSLGEGRALIVDESGKLMVLEVARPPTGDDWVELKQ